LGPEKPHASAVNSDWQAQEMKSPLIRLKYRGVVVIDGYDPALVSQRDSRGFSKMRARLTECDSEIIRYASGSLSPQGPLLDLQFLSLGQINLRDPCDFSRLNDFRLRARGQLLECGFSTDDLCAVRPGPRERQNFVRIRGNSRLPIIVTDNSEGRANEFWLRGLHI
jgi:hypothetical protein